MYYKTVDFMGELFETADKSWWHLTCERECRGTIGVAGVDYAIPLWKKVFLWRPAPKTEQLKLWY